MKIVITIFLCFISCTIQAQTWFDKSCDEFEENVTDEEIKTADERNIFKIIINQAGDTEINGEEKSNLNEIKFKEFVLDYVTNPNETKEKAEKPEKVIFQMSSFQKDQKSIQKYTDYIREVYLYIWDLESDKKYNTSYVSLNCKKRQKIFKDFPLRIINTKGKKNKENIKKMGPGVPVFGGDTVKN